MVVTFSGLDGVGKTTHVLMLYRWLHKQKINPKIVEAHKLSLYFSIGKLLKKIYPAFVKKLLNEQYDLLSHSRRRAIFGIFRKFAFWVDLIIFYLWVKIQKGKRTIILCDRSPLDELVQLTYLGFYLKKNFKNILKRLPPVDVPILLCVNPQEAYRRKPEYPLEHFVKKAELYSLATRVMPLYVIEGAKIEDVAPQIVTLINIHGLSL